MKNRGVAGPRRRAGVGLTGVGLRYVGECACGDESVCMVRAGRRRVECVHATGRLIVASRSGVSYKVGCRVRKHGRAVHQYVRNRATCGFQKYPPTPRHQVTDAAAMKSQ